MIARKTILQPLIESRSGLHLTIYLMNRGNVEETQAQLRLMINQAYEYLAPVLSRKKRNKFLEPIDSLISNPEKLRQIQGNIGIFRTLDFFQVIRVPVEVRTACHIATSFHVKPLLRWRQEDPDFLLIGISSESAHLYSGNQHSFKLLDSLHFSNIDFSNVEKAAREISEWLDEDLRKLPKFASARVFLVGPTNLTNALVACTAYKAESPTTIEMPFDESSCKEACDQIRKVLKEESLARTENFLQEFNAAEVDSRVQKNVFSISRAAAEGRVAKLVVCDEISIFGKIDSRSGGLSLHPFDLDHEDDDILDDLAQIVLRSGGEVLVAPRDQIPSARPVLALFNERRRPRQQVLLRSQLEVLEERFG